MSVFKDFEKKLEGLFEGVLLRAFKSGVQPVELGKKLVRELEGRKTLSVSRVYAPNRYEVGLSPRDYSRFETYQAVLATEFENLLISYIRERGYAVLDRPRVRLIEVKRLREGEFSIKCWLEGEPGAEGEAEGDRGGAVLTHPGGAAALELLDSSEAPPVFTLEKDSLSIGRDGNNDIVLPDPNVSRSHARVTRRGDSYFITDLGSTNGTWVNDVRVLEVELEDDDVIRMGTTRLVFRRSA